MPMRGAAVSLRRTSALKPAVAECTAVAFAFCQARISGSAAARSAEATTKGPALYG